jgi:hypothetical protein
MEEAAVPKFGLAYAGVAALVGVVAAIVVGPLLASGREAVTGAIHAALEPARAAESVAVVRRTPAERAVRRLAQANGARFVADPIRLEEQFPDLLPGGFVRRSVTSEHTDAIVRASAEYGKDAATLTVTTIQFGAEADATVVAAALNVAGGAQREGGYARTQTIDGRFYAEDVGAERARYVVIGRGVAMIAEGEVTIDQARAAVETIDLRRLESVFGR